MLLCLFVFLAIEIADCNNSRKLVKSLFIKMKAIQCLGDYVPALLLAVWCKHLKPVSKVVFTSCRWDFHSDTRWELFPARA